VHILARKDTVRLEDIPDGDLLLLEEGHCLRDQALAICNLVSLDARVKATSLTTLIRLVERNRGVTLLPALAAKQVPQGLMLRPLADELARRSVRLVARRNFLRSGALKVVAEAAKGVAREMGL
jgi:LysR family hydrogen peroxide-inducible transcriptional activator